MNEASEVTGGQALAAQLAAEGVTDVFAVPGLQLDWAIDPLADAGLRLIVPRHEQATTYMADGYARTSGRVGVSMVVPGPGVLNAAAGLATAWACSSPVLMIAGQIPSTAIGRGMGLLHETPGQSELLASLSKWHVLVRDPGEVAAAVHEAVRQLRSDRPQPVVIEIPPDVLQARTRLRPVSPGGRFSRRTPEAGVVTQACALLARGRRPAIVAGGGARASRSGAALMRLAERLGAPVVVTESGKGVVDERHPLVVSTLGGRAVLAQADTVLVVGSRFLDAQGQPPVLPAQATVLYLNTERAHAGAPRPDGLVLEGDAHAGLEALLAGLPGDDRPAPQEGLRAVHAWCEQCIASIEPQASWLGAIRAALPDDGILVSEMTQVGYLAGVGFEVRHADTFVSPGFQGTLGYGFPTALGAAVAHPGRSVVSINGDGGFGWALQELATAARYRIGLVAIVFRDGAFGNVRRIQRRVFGRETGVELHNPDLPTLGRAFGVRTLRIGSPAELQDTLQALLPATEPVLVDVPVGEMPSAWHLIHPFVPAPAPLPTMPTLYEEA